VDEGHAKANWDNAYRMSIGDWGPTRLPLNYNPWTRNYRAIRRANMFLENVDLIPNSSEPFIDAEVRERMRGEAMFLRALFYSELLKFYGGVPIIDKTLTPDSEELFSARVDYDELVDFVVQQAELAAELLPYADEYPSAEYGRATKGAAWALISRVRLFAASPQFNNPDEQSSPWAGQYDPDKWIVAAEAARDFIENAQGQYALHTSTAPGEYGDFEDLFRLRYSPEIILSYQYENMRRDGDHMHVERVCIPGPFFNYGHGVINNMPVLNLVADYEVVELDGDGNVVGSHVLGLERVKELYANAEVDPVSGFDPQNPYANRDPRFYQSIWYQGVRWPANPSDIFNFWRFAPNPSTTGVAFLDGWYNTGFMHRKFVNPHMRMTGWHTYNNETHNWPLFRYAEMLLNYAEAVNEAFGPEVVPAGYPMSAKEAVDMIRARATYPSYANAQINPPGMPVSAAGQSLPPLPSGLSQDEMRDRIRLERRIELSWEDHRFWDVRRWQIGDQTQDIWAQQIWIHQDASITYEISNANLPYRQWHDRFSLFPIMEVELRKSPDLVQNPGW
jgi:starch-binding outer membrane protein, SusD/RagB family